MEHLYVMFLGFTCLLLEVLAVCLLGVPPLTAVQAAVLEDLLCFVHSFISSAQGCGSTVTVTHPTQLACFLENEQYLLILSYCSLNCHTEVNTVV